MKPRELLVLQKEGKLACSHLFAPPLRGYLYQQLFLLATLAAAGLIPKAVSGFAPHSR
jgi:hypothetical protein